MEILLRVLMLSLVAGIAACNSSQSAPQTSQAAKPASQDAAFEALANRYVDEFTRFSPIDATRIGDHRYDAQIDDLSVASREAQLKWDRELLATLDKIDRKRLSRANQVDAALLANALRHDIWSLTQAKYWAWDPLLYNELAGSAIYNLMVREFAPLPERLKSLTVRLERLHRIYDQEHANLDFARVPKIHAEQARERNPGVLNLIDELVKPHVGALTGADRDRLVAAIDAATHAIKEQQKWIENQLVPNATGNFRFGAELYDARLAFALQSRLSRAEIRYRAEADLKRVREEMYGIAREALAGRPQAPAMPDKPTPEQQRSVIKAALALAAADHPPRDGQIEFATDALNRATDFVREKNLMTVPNDPVQVIVMPKFKRGLYVGACDSPGPLDVGQKTFYELMPIPEEWDQEKVDSFQREYNKRVIEIWTFHEAMPGHYLQIAASNRYPSKLRAVLMSGNFLEGWATYAQRMMVEVGWRNGDPLMKLSDRKVFLRALANVLIDQGMHVDGMTREEAMRLMMQETFQEEPEAAGKFQRGQLSPTQLSTYLVGVNEVFDLREEAKRRWGAKFNLKDFHDRVLSYGSPPVRYVRALMFDLPIEP